MKTSTIVKAKHAKLMKTGKAISKIMDIEDAQAKAKNTKTIDGFINVDYTQQAKQAKGAEKAQGATKAQGDTKASKRTLYAFSMGNGDGTSLFGRMFYFALYDVQGVGDGKAASFKAGKPFRYYPGFNAGYFRAKQVIERTPDGLAYQFTNAGASMMSAYPIPADAHKQYDAIKSAIVSGKPKDTGRDNQKMFAFNV